MEAPRTRYKVVERGRRLEVVDSWNGDAPVQRRAPDSAPPPVRSGPAPVEALRAPRLDSRGHRILATKVWYDAKGPRQIVLTDVGEQKMKGLWLVAFVALFILAVAAFLFWPLLFILPFLLARGNVRQGFRKAGAAFLDNINQPVTDSSSG